ncbi:MAG: potassium channel family protein [Oceanidesulfovibrio sp.]
MALPWLKIRYSRLRARFGVFGPILMGSLVLMAIFVLAIVFYMRMEGWTFWDSFYMTVITLSTVGFQEVQPLSVAGRLFTSMLILAGVGSFAFMAGSVAQLLVEGKINELLGRRRVQKTIDKLSDHYIVCGYGRIGAIVSREISHDGRPLVVIENDPDTLDMLDKEGLLYIAGDATSDEVLLAAGLERASCLITALTQEASNVYVVLTARQLNPTITIISRADNERHINRLEMAGANRVVLPHTIGGVRMAQSALRPTVTSFLEIAVRGGIDLQMEELHVSKDSTLVGKDLIESRVRQDYNLIIIAIKKSDGTMQFNPTPKYIIEAGDTLLAIGNQENLEQVSHIL